MRQIIKLIQKDFKLLFRSKASSMVVLLAPLLIIFLVGIAFDHSNTYNIDIGVVANDFNEEINDYINKLDQKEFNVIPNDNISLCIQDMKEGAVDTCVLFSDDFNLAKDNEKGKLTYYVDYSKINLAYMITDTISGKIGQKNDELSKDLTSILLDKIELTKSEILSQKESLNSVVENSNSNKDSLGSTKEQITSIDSSFAEDKFQTSLVQVKINDLKLNHDELKTFLDGKLNDSKNDISSAKSTLNGMNSSDADSVKLKLSNIETNIDGAIDKVKSLSNSTKFSVQEAIDLIGEAETELDSIKARMTALANSKVEVNTNLDNVLDSLKSSEEKLNLILTSFNIVQDSLSSLVVTDADKIVTPVETVIEPISINQTYLNYVFPSLIVLIIMFVGILLSSTLITMEKNSQASFRNFITPVSNFKKILATYLTSLIILTFQTIVILIISVYFFKEEIMSNLGGISLVFFLISSVFILLGILIGLVFSSEETGTIASISLSTLLLVLSDMILPLESMSGKLLSIVKFNPFVIGNDLMKQAILFSHDFKLLDFKFILIYILMLFLIINYLNSRSFLKLKQYFRVKRLKKKKLI